MTSDQTIGIYGQGLFGSDTPTQNRKYLGQLQTSAFNLMMLFTLHVDAHFDLAWSSTPIASNGAITNEWTGMQEPKLPDLVRGLRQGGFDTILFSVGSADVSDWHNIQTALEGTADDWDHLQKNFRAVADWLQIDGFDIDCEEPDILPRTIAAAAAMLAPLGAKNIITCAPYGDQTSLDWWLSCMEVIVNRNGRQLVDWWNVQDYGWAAADPRQWLAGVEKQQDAIGVKDPAAFIRPGFAATGADGDRPGRTPRQMQDVLDGLVDLQLTGSFVWNARTILDAVSPPAPAPRAYAEALRNGLDGRPGR